jgi:hypothetical protein
VFGAYIQAISSAPGGQNVSRYDPPTALSPTLSHSIPTTLNPLPHAFFLATVLKPLTISIRLLSPADSPGSEVVSGDVGADVLCAACEGLIAQLGKMKNMSLSWEDKVSFLKLYREKQGRSRSHRTTT